jgi:hypothetical protein
MSVQVTKDKDKGTEIRDIQTSVRMNKELLKRAKRYALDHDTSLAALITDALEFYMRTKK